MLNALKSIFSGSSPAAVGGSAGPASKTLVVDPGGGTKKRERLPPGAQVKILQRLSRFAEREKLNVSAVYEGKDLRAVSHGTEFQGVKVFFTQGDKELSKVIAEAVRAAPRTAGGVTVVSDDPEMEAAGKSAGANVMRLSSLEKAVEGGIRRGGGGGGNRSGRGGGQRNRRRRSSSEQQPRMSRQGGSDTDPVRDLLDLVD